MSAEEIKQFFADQRLDMATWQNGALTLHDADAVMLNELERLALLGLKHDGDGGGSGL